MRERAGGGEVGKNVRKSEREGNNERKKEGLRKSRIIFVYQWIVWMVSTYINKDSLKKTHPFIKASSKSAQYD